MYNKKGYNRIQRERELCTQRWKESRTVRREPWAFRFIIFLDLTRLAKKEILQVLLKVGKTQKLSQLCNTMRIIT